MTTRPPSWGLTRRQKRWLVRGRLAEPDAVAISDRAIARELGVSQPFVSALRRLSHGAPGAGAPDTVSDPAPLAEGATSSPAAPRPTGDDDVLSGEMANYEQG